MKNSTYFTCLGTFILETLEDKIDGLYQGFTLVGGRVWKYVVNNGTKLSGYLFEDHTPACDPKTAWEYWQNETLYDDKMNKCPEPFVIDSLAYNHSAGSGYGGMQIFLLNNNTKMEVVNGLYNIQGKVYNLVDNVFYYKDIASFMGLNGKNCTIEHIVERAHSHFDSLDHVVLLSQDEYAQLHDNSNLNFINNLLSPVPVLMGCGVLLLTAGGFYLLGKYHTYKATNNIKPIHHEEDSINLIAPEQIKIVGENNYEFDNENYTE